MYLSIYILVNIVGGEHVARLRVKQAAMEVTCLI